MSGYVQFLNGDWSHMDVAGKNYEGSSEASVYAFLWNPCTLFPCIRCFPQGSTWQEFAGLFSKYKLLYGIYRLQSRCYHQTSYISCPYSSYAVSSDPPSKLSTCHACSSTPQSSHAATRGSHSSAAPPT
ncbi:hypothetical protein Tco_0854330 [Tanacetum coccineum]